MTESRYRSLFDQTSKDLNFDGKTSVKLRDVEKSADAAVELVKAAADDADIDPDRLEIKVLKTVVKAKVLPPPKEEAESEPEAEPDEADASE